MTPEEVTDDIKALVKKINTNFEPIYIKSKPIKNAPINECIPIVENKVNENGGEMVLGWQIWENKIIVEAEFHAVWKSPAGELLDISPKAIEVDKILFVPDVRFKYEGKQINNIKMNIIQNSLVDDFIEICDALFEIENKEERAYQKEVTFIGEEANDYNQLKELKGIIYQMVSRGFTKNTFCFCGNQVKYKHCHGKEIRKLIKKYKK